MLIAAAHTRVTRRQGAVWYVCARPLWECQANFDGQGIVVGTKREPQPMTYKGEAP
jgi:hypothetical protein